MKLKNIINKESFQKTKDKYKKKLSEFYITKIKKISKKEFVEKIKKKLSEFYITKIKEISEKEFVEKYKKKFIKFTTAYQNYAEKFIDNLINEEGSEIWSGLTQSQKWSGRLIWTFVGVTSFGIIWSFITLIDETVQVQGKLEPLGTTIDVKVPLGGVIKTILVSEGEIVNEDQVLLELDTRAVKSKLETLTAVKSQIEADNLLSKIQLGEKVDINLLNENQKIKLNSLKNEYNSRIAASRNTVDQSTFRRDSNIEKIKTLKETLLIREDILKKLEGLIEIGGLSKLQYLKEQQEVIQLRGKLETTKNDLKTSLAILNEAENKLSNTIAATKIDFSTKIEENEKQISQLNNQIKESQLTLSYQEIKSPLNGIVFDLQPAAPGYVVNTELPILKIVPIDDLVARVFVSNRDIAFLKVGQGVKVRVDAYPYNEFGEIEGLIDSIGSDVLEPDKNFNFYRFPITIKLKNPYIQYKNKELPLRSGMSLSVNIVLRQRPVLSLFTERILPFWSGLEQL